MAPYHSHGFIGQQIHSWVKATKRTHKPLFELAERINADCYQSLGSVTIDSGSLRQTLIACLFARCLELFQASYILVSHGMSPSGSVTLRALLEATFVLCATAKDDAALEAYVIDGEREKLRVARKLLADKDSTLSEDRLDVIRGIQNELDEKMKEQKIMKFSTEDFAIKAGLHSWYLTAYAKTSWAVHTTIRDMERHIVLDDEEKLKSITFIPTDEGTVDVLSTACTAMIISLGELLSLFGADTTVADMYGKELERVMTKTA
ncbi:MAG: hypothetical protein A4E60_03283 [Syntrophorhabdus sp. PtaB.Bin047]|nr:MAG: hypothetical protein A4E60_03283 [Syntrophorhabdus sp. PtaB.Bin047]